MRTRHQPASPSATNLTPLNSLRSSAIQPASTPNLVAASLQARWLVAGSLQARWLAYVFLKGLNSVAIGDHRGSQPATARHRMSDSLVLKPPKINENLPRPAEIQHKSINPHWIPEIKRASPPGCYFGVILAPSNLYKYTIFKVPELRTSLFGPPHYEFA